MATHTTTVLIDDITGNELPEGAGEAVRFALDGVTYEIDVDTKTAARIRSTLEPYVAAGRRAVGQSSRRRTALPSGRPAAPALIDNAAVRAWAASNGVQVSDRGRLPGHVIAQFRAAGH